jgi:hypothetical protein
LWIWENRTWQRLLYSGVTCSLRAPRMFKW